MKRLGLLALSAVALALGSHHEDRLILVIALVLFLISFLWTEKKD